MRRVVLASASPRRAELIRAVAQDVEILPQDAEERTRYRRPHCIVQDLARIKAGDLKDRYPDRFVIGADTIVWRSGKLYGKPLTEARAATYLRELQGKRHSVYTGVYVAYRGRERTFWVKSDVAFRTMSDREIADYIARKQPLDKAGAYGIQDNEVVQSYRGSYTNIVGLPLERLERVLQEMEKTE